jgi:hypothetical protein
VWEALENLPFVAALAGSSTLYVLISALHIGSFAVLIGAITVIDLRLIGAVSFPGIDAGLPTLRRFALAGFTLAVCSGLLLFAVQATRYVDNPPFKIKLLCIAAAGVNALTYEVVTRWRGAGRARHYPRVAGALSLLLWGGVLLGGRWIAFT